MNRLDCHDFGHPMLAWALTIFVSLAGGADLVCTAGEVTISLVERQGEAILIVRGVPDGVLDESPLTREQWAEVLRVAVDRDDSSDVPAMLGSYRVDAGDIVFQPRYPFRSGLAYVATYQAGDSSPVVYRFKVPARSPSVPTMVRAVYPSADQVPENLLKFYIHFSAPMRHAVAYDHVRVLRRPPF